MTDKQLLVPGTSGSKLLINGKDLGWPVELSIEALLSTKINLFFGFDFNLIDPQKMVDKLSMEYDENVDSFNAIKTTLVDNSEITPGPVLKPVYNQFADIETFVYDWRSDIRNSGDLLLKFLEENKPSNGRWQIVCHSQGGLVVVAASKLYAKQKGQDPDAFSKLVSKIAFVGVPFHGTVNAVDAFLNGENLTKPFKDHFKTIVRTWPSIYQMLPTWVGCVKQKIGGQLKPVYEYNLLYDTPWEKYQLDNHMLDRARVTRRDFLRSPISYMNKIDKRIFMSAAYETANHVVINENGNLSIGSPMEEGDGLVPEYTTRSRCGQSTCECMLSLGSLAHPGETMKHAFLCADPVFASGVKQFFKGE